MAMYFVKQESEEPSGKLEGFASFGPVRTRVSIPLASQKVLYQGESESEARETASLNSAELVEYTHNPESGRISVTRTEYENSELQCGFVLMDLPDEDPVGELKRKAVDRREPVQSQYGFGLFGAFTLQELEFLRDFKLKHLDSLKKEAEAVF